MVGGCNVAGRYSDSNDEDAENEDQVDHKLLENQA